MKRGKGTKKKITSVVIEYNNVLRKFRGKQWYDGTAREEQGERKGGAYFQTDRQ